MKIILLIFDILMISVGNYTLINSFFLIKKNKSWILFYVFYFLFIVPIILDIFLGSPRYETGFRYGYVLIAKDPTVTIIYDIIISFLCLVFNFFLEFKYPVQKPKDNSKFIENRYIKFALFFCACLPLALFLVACVISRRSPTFILDLGWRYKYEMGELSELFAQSAIERLTYIGVTCSFLLIFSVNYTELFRKSLNGRRDYKLICKYLCMILVLVVCSGINLLLEGKRSIYLFAGIVFFAILFYKVLGKIKPWIAAALFLTIVGGLVLVVLVLGDSFRGATIDGTSLSAYKYASLHVDFFRDQSLKMVIFSFLHSKELPMLSYPFQSYLTEIFFLFPIVYLPVPFKKGYETYLTATFSFIDSSHLGSMRITNSGLDELVANFSVFGVLAYALLLIWLFKKMSEASDDWNVIIFVAFVLFMMYSTSYICWFYEFIVGIIIVSWIGKIIDKKKEVSLNAQ